jgi:hypothetical protein
LNELTEFGVPAGASEQMKRGIPDRLLVVLRCSAG